MEEENKVETPVEETEDVATEPAVADEEEEEVV